MDEKGAVLRQLLFYGHAILCFRMLLGIIVMPGSKGFVFVQKAFDVASFLKKYLMQ
jgi:hypothetical protein